MVILIHRLQRFQPRVRREPRPDLDQFCDMLCERAVSYQRPDGLTRRGMSGRWYVIDFARSRHTNPARIPVSPAGCWYQRPQPAAPRLTQRNVFLMLVSINAIPFSRRKFSKGPHHVRHAHAEPDAPPQFGWERDPTLHHPGPADPGSPRSARPR